jgi:hypothetical protein
LIHPTWDADSSRFTYQLKAHQITCCFASIGKGTVTGLASSIGEIGPYNISGLVFDPDNNVLYGSDTTKRQLVIIDPKNGNVIDHGPNTGDALTGLAYRQ